MFAAGPSFASGLSFYFSPTFRTAKLHSDGAWLRLSRRRARLGEPTGSVVAVVDHNEAAFCVEILEDAMARHGKPEIFNTDQGSQFTGSAFTGVLANNGIAISMDGKAPDGITCSSSVCGAASNTRRCICGPTTASTRPALRSVNTWTFTTAHQNTHLAM
jgi:hypothetical protein